MTAGKFIIPEPCKKTPLGELTVVLVDHINSNYNGMHTYFEWLCLRILNGDSAFPMAFFCPNWFKLAAIVQIDRLCELESCRHTLTKEWTYWGVRNGREEVKFISGKCRTHIPLSVNSANPWYKSCPTMAKAMKWMLLQPAPLQDTPSRNSSRDATDGKVKKLSTKKIKHSGACTVHGTEASNNNGECSPLRVKMQRHDAFDHMSSIHKRDLKGHFRATLFITPAPSENWVSSLGR
ncbi:hypothetical protein BC835DRAFT_1311283 [Cytidiella melzeri]|nr:hypothetical protein BC835DRAFT_1311283 [Cytidiella melzeri]